MQPRVLLFALCLTIPVSGVAQTTQRTWKVDTSRSRAWYLIQPHYGHLYASTCRYDYELGSQNLKGSSPNGLHSGPDPRKGLSPAGTGQSCANAIVGEISAENPNTWTKARASIVVSLDSLVGPSASRDHHLKTQILHTEKQPVAKFVFDSLVKMVPGDTVTAVVAGTMELNGVPKSVLAPAKIWFEPDGSLRVNAEVGLHPRALVNDYKFERRWIGLGWFMWTTLTFGVDLLLRESTASTNLVGH
jgi:YceI-like domain